VKALCMKEGEPYELSCRMSSSFMMTKESKGKEGERC
jgi:hypothetical protein